MTLLLDRALSPGVDSLAVPPSPSGRSVEAISDVFRLLHGLITHPVVAFLKTWR